MPTPGTRPRHRHRPTRRPDRSPGRQLDGPAARGRHPRRLPRRASGPGPGAGERVDGGGGGGLSLARLASEPSPGRRTNGSGSSLATRGPAAIAAGARRDCSGRRTSPPSSRPAIGRGRESEEVALVRGRLDAVIAGLPPSWLGCGGARWARCAGPTSTTRPTATGCLVHRPPREDPAGGPANVERRRRRSGASSGLVICSGSACRVRRRKRRGSSWCGMRRERAPTSCYDQNFAEQGG